MKILVAEDGKATRRILRALLERYGEVAVAADGATAIESYTHAVSEGQPYDLILLDVMMPKINGLEVLKHIRLAERRGRDEGHPLTKVIMVTAVSDRDQVTEILRHGCDAYILKPYDGRKLEAEFRRLGLIRS